MMTKEKEKEKMAGNRENVGAYLSSFFLRSPRVPCSVDNTHDGLVHDLLLSLPSTLICICHRLTRVPDFDQVIVVDQGQVISFVVTHAS